MALPVAFLKIIRRADSADMVKKPCKQVQVSPHCSADC
jgi:hypothetical protein